MQIKPIIAILAAVGMVLSPGRVYEQAQPPETYQPSLASSPDPLDAVIRHLSWCESRENSQAINPYDGGSPSYGLHQYKWATWNWALDKYDLFSEAEKEERWNLLWDREAQILVTKTILTDNPNSYKLWYNCLKSIYEKG